MRCTPLRSDVAKILREWKLQQGGKPEDSVFPSSRKHRLPAYLPMTAIVVTRANYGTPDIFHAPSGLHRSCSEQCPQRGLVGDRNWPGHWSALTIENDGLRDAYNLEAVKHRSRLANQNRDANLEFLSKPLDQGWFPVGDRSPNPGRAGTIPACQVEGRALLL